MLFGFVLAGLTGVLFRLGMIGHLPEWLALQNVRHAHSHLMFFAWAAPLPLWLMWREFRYAVPADSGALRWMNRSVLGGISLGLVAWLFFLLYGYRPVPFGEGIPLSVILSGLVMLSWYGYMAGYLILRSRVSHLRGAAVFEGALMLLLLSTLGAWGVAVVPSSVSAGILNAAALTHFFLACFTEGWVALAVLALLRMAISQPRKARVRWEGAFVGLIVLGAPLTFAYGLSEPMLSTLTLGVARAGGIMSAAGLLGMVWILWRQAEKDNGGGLLRWPLGMLALKGIMQLSASLAPTSFLPSDHGFRILYLHVLLLGALTLGGVALLYLRTHTPPRGFHLMAAAVTAVLVSLMLPTPLIPSSWFGSWLYRLLAIAAVLPVLAMGGVWWQLYARADTFTAESEI